MPIVRVHALPQKPDVDASRVLADVCRGLAEHLGVGERQVWGTWESLRAGHYVEGGSREDRQPGETHPPLVRVQVFEGRPAGEVEGMLARVAHLVGRGLGIDPQNVFVHYEELPSGRVYAGGNVLKRT